MIAGIVLAAGAATRFGAPKQLAPLEGVPLLQHAVDAALGARSLDEVVVVLGAHAAEVREAVDLRAARAVEAPDWQEGLAASLRAGLRAAGEDHGWYVVLLGDMPRVTPALVDATVAHALAAGPPAVRAAHGGVPGHPVALHRSLRPALLALRGDDGARELLAGTPTFDAGPQAGLDVDTPEELEALSA